MTNALSKPYPDYWVKTAMCLYNAHYNVKFLGNEATHKIRCGQLFYKGDIKTEGEVNFMLKDYNHDLSNAHLWVETSDGKVIDWIVTTFGQRDRGVKRKVWTKEEVKEMGIVYVYSPDEAQVLKRANTLYGDADDAERYGWY
jgi:hypothetical protein